MKTKIMSSVKFLLLIVCVSTVYSKGIANAPLNLDALSAKDTASFETYSQRLTLINDSINSCYAAMEAAKKNAEATMPKLGSKGEFEKQAEFEVRAQKWQTDLAQRIEKEAKPYNTRLAELEKAKSKVQSNQTSLYGSVDIKTTPSAVSVWLGKEEIGASPALYSLLIPGTVKIILRKEGYNQWDTTFQVAPGAKYSINAELEEKSIFSQENEINFVKILNKDTTLQGYEARIKTIETRMVQIAEEIKAIIEDFPNVYPALEPKAPNESQEDFKRRYEAWNREGVRQYGELQKKCEDYKNKLNRSVAVLNDYIIALQSSIVNEPAINAKVELAAYDAEKEHFNFVAIDTENAKSPFLFNGKVAVPRDMAKSLNRSAPGFAATVQFINYPFETGAGSVNLAMSELLLSSGGQNLKIEGSFSEIERYKAMDGYAAWKPRADSLLNGSLKLQGLDYNYAMGKAIAKKADAKEEDSSGGLGWRGWTRIAAFTTGAGLTGAYAFKHKEAKRTTDKDEKEKRKLHRNIYAGSAGACVLVGAITFFF
jgi:hypothetical protein